MRYRVGLDVGTASLGVAAVSLDENNQPTNLIWIHVRIFDEPLEKGTKGQLISKKAGRRVARMQRRQIDRRLSRTKQIAGLASLLGIQVELSEDSGATLLAIRAKAAREQVSLSDLIRVFIRLGKRRGYPADKFSKKGEVEGGSSDLKVRMNEIAQSRGLENITLGEYLQVRWQQGLPTKLKIKEKRDKEDELQNLYALRHQVEAEFEQIWQTQSAFYPALGNQHDGKTVKEKFKHAIFYQRPLKAVGGMVGQCGLEPTLARAPRAQPAFQHFRIEKTLADLRWGAGKRADKLSAEQRAVIRQLCDEEETVKFEAIYKALESAGCVKPNNKGLNLERLSRDEIPGNKTNHIFNKLGLGEAWAGLEERTQIQVINFLADLGSPEQLDDPVWYTRFAKVDGTLRQLPEAFVVFINQLKSHEKFDRLSKIQVGLAKFDNGRASYSIKALKNITGWLSSKEALLVEHPDEAAAILACYPYTFNQPIAFKQQLDTPAVTGNAVVDGSLRQIRYVMNRMIQELGEVPEQIVVEMAREMSVGVSKRNERESENLKNRKARLSAEKAISDSGVTVTPSRVRRYLLWVEQDKGHCPYCDKKMINLSDALNGAETEYEHILPKSLTQVGLKRSEIVLAHRSCNQEKGNRTPFQAFGHDEYRWKVIQSRAKFFTDKKAFRKAKLLLLEDFENEVLNDDSIASFADRQFHQTSWIAKEAAQWLQSVCKTLVSVSRGEMTAGLRRKWKLETVIPQARVEEGLPILDEEGAIVTPEEFAKYRDVWDGHRVLDNHGKLDKARHTDRKLDKRIDHRHHLIDAITIALTSRSLFAQMARQYKLDSERVGSSEKPRLRIGEALPLKNVRELALNAVRECPLSIKHDRYPDGALFKDNPYGRAYSEKDDCFMLTKRSKLGDLVFDLKEKKGKDGAPKKTVEQQARENILTIVSNQTRQLILKEFERRLKEGKTVEETMQEPIYQNLYGKKIEIKKVLCFSTYSAEEASPIEHANKHNVAKPFFKYLRDDEYAYMEVMNHENGTQSVNLVSRREGMAQKGKKVSQGVIRYYKGDILKDLANGNRYKVKKYAAKSNGKPRPTLITLRWTESGGNIDKIKQCAGRMDFFEERLSQIKLVNQNV